MLTMHTEHVCVCVFTSQVQIGRDGGGGRGASLSGRRLGGQIPDSIDRHIEQIIIKQLIIDPTQIIEKSQTPFCAVPHLDDRFVFLRASLRRFVSTVHI